MLRTCKECAEEKDISDFRFMKAGKSGPLYTHVCKLCLNARNKAWRESNKDHLKQYDKARQTSERRASCINWQHSNRERLREYARKRYRETPWVFSAHVALRRARQANATPPWLPKNACDFAYVAAKMFEKSYGGSWTVDHIVPLTSNEVCGLHVPWNLVLVSKSENSAKGNRWWPDGW